MLAFICRVLLLSGAVSAAIVLAGTRFPAVEPDATVALVTVTLPVAGMAAVLAWRSRTQL